MTDAVRTPRARRAGRRTLYALREDRGEEVGASIADWLDEPG